MAPQTHTGLANYSKYLNKSIICHKLNRRCTLRHFAPYFALPRLCSRPQPPRGQLFRGNVVSVTSECNYMYVQSVVDLPRARNSGSALSYAIPETLRRSLPPSIPHWRWGLSSYCAFCYYVISFWLIVIPIDATATSPCCKGNMYTSAPISHGCLR
ncbi:hypothetical protein H4582DRAFT_2014022 [Lactarius indigo]|nr:hypothetical protein H4582DRAFT_2014022 [Lactarius indigo]